MRCPHFCIQTIYHFIFASEGHTGMGDFDLFMSKRIHSDTTWNTPKNVRYPINTYKTENSLAVSSDK